MHSGQEIADVLNFGKLEVRADITEAAESSDQVLVRIAVCNAHYSAACFAGLLAKWMNRFRNSANPLSLGLGVYFQRQRLFLPPLPASVMGVLELAGSSVGRALPLYHNIRATLHSMVLIFGSPDRLFTQNRKVPRTTSIAEHK